MNTKNIQCKNAPTCTTTASEVEKTVFKNDVSVQKYYETEMEPPVQRYGRVTAKSVYFQTSSNNNIKRSRILSEASSAQESVIKASVKSFKLHEPKHFKKPLIEKRSSIKTTAVLGMDKKLSKSESARTHQEDEASEELFNKWIDNEAKTYSSKAKPKVDKSNVKKEERILKLQKLVTDKEAAKSLLEARKNFSTQNESIQVAIPPKKRKPQEEKLPPPKQEEIKQEEHISEPPSLTSSQSAISINETRRPTIASMDLRNFSSYSTQQDALKTTRRVKKFNCFGLCKKRPKKQIIFENVPVDKESKPIPRRKLSATYTKWSSHN